MSTPRTAKLSGTINWSDGSPFHGYVVIALVNPVGYTYVTTEANVPGYRLPSWMKIPIVDGAYNQDCDLFYTADIQPPTTKYAAYFYDNAGKLIAPAAGTAALFAVTATPHALVAPTLTVPAAATVAPSPET